MTAKRTSVKRRSIRQQVSEAEWAARVELAALYRALAKMGITDHIYNHITLRVPGVPDNFLVNAYGMTYPEVTASSFYKVDVDAKVVLDPENGYGHNPAAFLIHSTVHGARHDMNCVMHTHTRATIAVGAMKVGLLPLSQHAATFDGQVSYYRFNGPIVEAEEKAVLVRDLGPTNKVMFLRNHGTLILGETIAETFLNCYMLEMGCKIQVDAMSVGMDGLSIPSDEGRANSRRIIDKASQDIFSGHLEWAAMRRMVDRDGTDYAA